MVLTVKGINSITTQIPYDFYELNICPPDDMVKLRSNFGERLMGSTTYQSNYHLIFNHNECCKVLCEHKFNKVDHKKVKWSIEKEYGINWILDGLPVGNAKTINSFDSKPTLVVKYSGGIPLGYVDQETNETYIYNHYRIYIGLSNMTNIVSFEIEPLSLKQNSTDVVCISNKETNVFEYMNKEHQLLTQGEKILFTYDVIFTPSGISYGDRFNNYKRGNNQVHWVGFANSNVLILVLTIVTICLFTRALRNDIEIYNEKVTGDEIIDEYGWKNICNDVFRKPSHGILLSALFGTGAQILIMISYTLLFSVIGFFRPEASGSFITMMILVFVFMGVVSGYCSGRFFKTIQGRNWLRCSLMTAVLFPGTCFIFLTIVNVIFRYVDSSVGLHFKEIFSLLLLWIGCSVPLVLLGTFIGVKQRLIKTPCKINTVPAKIEPKPWFFHLKYSCWITGILPFSSVFVELIYILSALWRHEMYFLESFAALALVILLITTTEISIIFVYLNLCR